MYFVQNLADIVRELNTLVQNLADIVRKENTLVQNLADIVRKENALVQNLADIVRKENTLVQSLADIVCKKNTLVQDPKKLFSRFRTKDREKKCASQIPLGIHNTQQLFCLLYIVSSRRLIKFVRKNEC